MKPREKMRSIGVNSLSNEELLAILLRTGGGGKSVLALSREILEEFPRLSELVSASLDELLSVKGIGMAKATSLKAALELGKRLYLEMLRKPKKIRSPEDVYSMCEDMWFHQRELLRVIAVDESLSYISHKDFPGISSAVSVEIRDLMKFLLRVNASAFFLAHNHRSNISPSEDDKLFTLKALEAGDILGIRLMDHIIVGPREFYSFAKKGLI